MSTCTTEHRILFDDARNLDYPPVHLVVTSPPYPMIGMWDAAFAAMSPASALALSEGEPWRAFEAMHQELDRVWAACHRALCPGGFLCVNIGDATRSFDGSFAIYPNHARILMALVAMGFTPLPDILWRKPNNSPTKFMGSGMLPAGAYVTYEHEYILIARKGGKRAYPRPEEREARRRSAFFWEERNSWFSDLWTDLRGTPQELGDPATRGRSAAFPFELAWRVVLMFSQAGDTVLDPFAGTGTTLAAALATGRNSVGVELDEGLANVVRTTLERAIPLGRSRLHARLAAHKTFVEERQAKGQSLGHFNAALGEPVMTAQETGLQPLWPRRLRPLGESLFAVDYDLEAGSESLSSAATFSKTPSQTTLDFGLPKP